MLADVSQKVQTIYMKTFIKRLYFQQHHIVKFNSNIAYLSSTIYSKHFKNKMSYTRAQKKMKKRKKKIKKNSMLNKCKSCEKVITKFVILLYNEESTISY